MLCLAAAVPSHFSVSHAQSAGLSPTPPPPTAPTNAPVEAWNRIVLIGASATAGFMLPEPLGGPKTDLLRLDRYLDAALLAPHQPLRNLGHSLFFLQPEQAGRQQVDQALKLDPSLLIGADFMFWFCYGAGRTDEERLQRLEYGLKLLEPVRCPLVIGDIPDASATVNIMLRPDQIPTPKALAAANARLRAWAAQRKLVFVLPLHDFMAGAISNRSLTLHGQTLPAGKTRALLQDDNLHPTPAGAATIALAILDLLHSAQPDRFPGPILWNRDQVLKLGSATPQSATPTSSP
jgi:hypothetical protein